MSAAICTEMIHYSTDDLLAMLTAMSGTCTVAGMTRHGIELRSYPTEEIVTLGLGHAPDGLVCSLVSVTNSCCSDSFAAQSSGNARVGRVSIIITECVSGARSMGSTELMPAFLSTFIEVIELA